MEINSVMFSKLLLETKDGDWGKGEAYQGYLPYRVIRGTDFADASSGDLSNIPIRYLAESSVQRRTLQSDDIIIETAGGSNDRPTGRTFLIKRKLIEDSDLPLTCASFCRFLRVNPELADPRYVYWYLQYLYVKGEMWIHQVKHTGIARFQYTRFASTVQVPLPSRFEQQAIAHILGSLDDKIELNRQMNETLEGIARALFKSWFVDFDPVRAKMEGRQPYGMDAETAALFSDRFEDSALGEIPRGWKVVPLASKVEILTGGTPKTSIAEYWKGTVPWVSIIDTVPGPYITSTEKTITELGVENSAAKILPIETIVITARGTVGNCALLSKPMAINQSCYGLQGKEYIGQLFLFHQVYNQISHLKASAHGSVFDTITRSTFDTILIVSPEAEVLEKFETLVRSLFNQILSNQLQSATLITLRDTLLPKLLSGELRVGQAEKEVEAMF